MWWSGVHSGSHLHCIKQETCMHFASVAFNFPSCFSHHICFLNFAPFSVMTKSQGSQTSVDWLKRHMVTASFLGSCVQKNLHCALGIWDRSALCWYSWASIDCFTAQAGGRAGLIRASCSEFYPGSLFCLPSENEDVTSGQIWSWWEWLSELGLSSAFGFGPIDRHLIYVVCTQANIARIFEEMQVLCWFFSNLHSFECFIDHPQSLWGNTGWKEICNRNIHCTII